MADRYLRASGNWDGPVWAATSSGTAGSAATPTASDDVYLSTNRVVILTADAECNSILLSGPPMSPYGNIQLNEYDLHVFGSATAECTIDGNGTLTVDGNYTAHSDIDSFPSLIVLNNSGNRTFTTYSRVFNCVRINMSGTGETLNITGSPTFRLLDIRSANSAAHTVFFGDSVNATQYVLMGSSSNKLLLRNNKSPVNSIWFGMPNYGTFYGSNVQIGTSADLVAGANIVKGNYNASARYYLGSNSIANTLPNNFLIQDPPKISTLVDPLTTDPASNTNWTVTGDVTKVTTGHDGGGYKVTGKITSTDTYDLIDSWLIYQAKWDYSTIYYYPELSIDDTVVGYYGSPTSYLSGQMAGGFIDDASSWGGLSYSFRENNANQDITYADTISYSIPASWSSLGGMPSGQYRYIGLKINSNGTANLKVSADGTTWYSDVNHNNINLNSDTINKLRSVRLVYSGGATIGSINFSLKPKNTGAFLTFFYP